MEMKMKRTVEDEKDMITVDDAEYDSWLKTISDGSCSKIFVIDYLWHYCDVDTLCLTGGLSNNNNLRSRSVSHNNMVGADSGARLCRSSENRILFWRYDWHYCYNLLMTRSHWVIFITLILMGWLSSHKNCYNFLKISLFLAINLALFDSLII